MSISLESLRLPPDHSPSRPHIEPNPEFYRIVMLDGLPASILTTDQRLKFSVNIHTVGPNPSLNATHELNCEKMVCNSKTMRITDITDNKSAAQLLLSSAHEIAKSNNWALTVSDKADEETRRLLTELQFEKHFSLPLSPGI